MRSPRRFHARRFDRRDVRRLVVAGLVATAASVGTAFAQAGNDDASTETAPRFTFGWALDATHPKPRGGTTRGVPVAIDRQPSPAWTTLQSPSPDPREHDRRAILAMAGTWRVAFDFVEVASYVATARPIAPYQSWATEKVYVDRDEPGLVSLVHILEIRVVDAAGTAGDPIVTKHWRQEWTYEPTSVVEYAGRERWQRRAVGEAERRGAWRQVVLQVDESPRYASVGRWQHTASFSTWIGGETWRPLPRREWTVRNDYQVLVGTNRHTVTPTGWMQEENNLKTVLTAERTPDPTQPDVGREYGVARYERLREADFAAADRYYARTRMFWQRVEDAWSNDFARNGAITLLGQVDQKAYFVPLFERADRIVDEGPASDDASTIRTALDAMRAP